MAATILETQFLLKKLDDIPSLPAIVYELSRIINDPMSSTQEVENIMSKDIGMTTKVLKLANSAYYAIPGGVSNLSRAIAFIGFDTIHQLVLAASIIKTLETENSEFFRINEFWKHSVGVAIASEAIGKYIKSNLSSDLFTCGMIHDIGKMALHIIHSESVVEIIKYCNTNKVTYSAAEQYLGIMSHTEISKLLSEKWQLPKTMQAVARFHHEKELAKRGNLSNELHQAIDIVTLANMLVHALKFGHSGHSVVLGAPNEVLQRLMLDPQNDMPSLLKLIKENLAKSSDFISTIMGSQ